jgi:hypothetical protein
VVDERWMPPDEHEVRDSLLLKSLRGRLRRKRKRMAVLLEADPTLKDDVTKIDEKIRKIGCTIAEKDERV